MPPPQARRIALESCHNFRDMGGYRTHDGRRVRWGVLYRADTLHRLTEPDVARLRDLRIVTVVDLRSSVEVQRNGRVTETLVTDYHHLPMFDEVADPGRRAAIEERPPPGQAYIDMLDGAGPAMAAAVRALVRAAGQPAVIHCTAGKDRTGILAGLVLSVLGVAEADIVADYELTNETREEREAYLELHDPKYLAMLRSLPPWVREADGAAIRATLDHLAAQYGSPARYLEAAGVAPSELDALRGFLLEP